jgi:hypothetical protein
MATTSLSEMSQANDALLSRGAEASGGPVLPQLSPSTVGLCADYVVETRGGRR